jgi:RHS repeat-associated protein
LVPTRACDLNIETGAVTQSAVDAFLPGKLPFVLVRRYSSTSLVDGPFGIGWSTSLGLSLKVEADRIVLGGAGRGDDEFPRLQGESVLKDATGSLTLSASAIEVPAQRGLYRVLLVTESTGKSWVFDSQPSPTGEHRLLRRRDFDGNEIRFEYDHTSRFPVRVLDSVGREVHLRYEGQRLSQIDLASEASRHRWTAFRRFEYDLSGDLVSVIDANGGRFRYEYDRHYLVSVTNRVGGVSYFAYDGDGRAVFRWRADGSQYRSVLSDPATSRILLTNSFGHRSLFRLNEKGRVISEVDPLDRVREHIYDASGNLVFSTLNVIGPPCVTRWDPKERVETVTCGGSETQVRYNDFGKPLSIKDSRGHLWTFEYDGNGHRILQRFPTGAELRFAYTATGEVRTVLDPAGNRLDITNTLTELTFADSLGPLDQIEYDDLLGLPVSVTAPDGATARFDYDATGNLIRATWPDGAEDRRTYNAEGEPVELVDVLGARMLMGSDQFGRVTSATDANGNTYRVGWDAEDNFISIEDPHGAVAQFEYDPVNRLSTVVHFDGRTTGFEYDEFDRPVRLYNPATGTEASSDFDDLGLVARHTATGGPEWVLGYGTEGELLQASTSGMNWTFEWDAECQLRREVTPYRSIEHTHDLAGRRTSLQDDQGLRLDYEWDVRSRLTKLTIGERWSYHFRYGDRNLIREVRFPGGQTLSLDYDPMARWTSRVLRNRDRILSSRRLQWDRGGNLVRIDDSRIGTINYDVDPGGRLLAVRRDREIVERYRHDGQGNVLATADGDEVVLDGSNRIVAAGNRRFEFNGDGQVARRVTADGITEYAYDGDGFLRAVRLPTGTLIQYDYDALGRRVRRRADGRVTIFHWDGESVQGEATEGETPIWYIFLPASLIPLAVVTNDEIHSLLFNHIGTVTEAYDESGELSWAAELSAFLDLRREEGRLRQPIRGLGQYHEVETGLYYNYFRFYDPTVARYISPDPMHYENAMNLYWYSSNTNDHVDPDGLGFVNGVLTLRPHCDWSPEQLDDFNNKVADLRAGITDKGGEIRITAKDAENYDRDCGTAATKWKNECKDSAPPEDQARPPKNTGDPCVDVDIDHKVEYALGGKDECKNLTPRNASVNKAVGGSIGRMMAKAKPYKPVKLTSIAIGKCRNKKRDVAPCNSR